MKYFKLIWRNLFRNKLRAVLTLGLMFFIFILVSTLLAIQYNFDQFSDAGEGTNRLATQSAISLATPLPYAMEQKIRQIPGVADVCKVQWIGAYYKDPRDFFANFAIDHDHMASVFDDYRVDPKEFADFQKDRQGALVGTELMKRFKWTIGQRITLKRKIFPYDAELVIRGIYHHPVNTSAVYYHMDYHNHMVGDYSMTGNFWVKVKDAKQMSSVSQQIDAMFKNSEYPTETFTEKEFQLQFMSMMGNIKLLFTAVCSCAIFMVVLLAAITMSMSARERVTEIAVLKAIGYREGLVLTLMLIEFTLLALIGGASGTLFASGLFRIYDLGKASGGFLANFGVHTVTVLQCIGIAAASGVIAGGWPAIRAAHMSVVDGLRRVV